MKNPQTEQQTELSIRRLKKLYELSMTLSGDPIDVFKKITNILYELFDLRVVGLSEIRDNELCFLSVSLDGEIVTDVSNCPLNITPCATVKKTKDISTFDNVAERFPKAPFLKELNAFSYCGFPAFDSKGEVIVVTCLLDDKPHNISEEDQELLQILGQRIGLEMERQKIITEHKTTEMKLLGKMQELIKYYKIAGMNYKIKDTTKELEILKSKLLAYNK